MAELTSPEELSKLKVAELKKALKERGLNTTGSKSELVERLFGDVTKDQGKVMAETEAVIEEADNVLKEDSPSKPTITEIKSPVTPEKTKVVSPAAPKTDSAEEDTEEKKSAEEEEEKPSKVVKVGGLSDADRLKKRAERFGVLNEDLKKQTRAERFGLPATGSASKLSTAGAGVDLDMLKRRAERFGQVVSSSLTKSEEDDRIKKRKERFGEVTSATNNAPPAKFTKISFNSSDLEDKKRKRAERFATS